jgi:hypothetical protein
MSAKKLGRLAGFVFVLAAVFGGVGSATTAPAHETGDSSAVTAAVVRPSSAADIVWI